MMKQELKEQGGKFYIRIILGLFLALSFIFFGTTLSSVFAAGSPDVNFDAYVDVMDLGIVLSSWGQTASEADSLPADINGDDVVDITDLGTMLSYWNHEAWYDVNSSTTQSGGDGFGTTTASFSFDFLVDTSCAQKGCFADVFSQCEVDGFAILKAPVLNLVYEYQILGPESSLCKMASEYLEFVDNNFTGKQMTCLYDNNKSFLDATQEVTQSFNTDTPIGNCSGSLYDLLISSPTP